MSAFQKALRLFEVRDRSVKEMTDKLVALGYEADDVACAISKCIECRILDDKRFADMFIRSYVSRGKGSCAVERDLAKRHAIDACSVEGYPEAYGLGETQQIERAAAHLQARPPRAQNMKAAAYRRLVGKGYASSVALQASEMFIASLR